LFKFISLREYLGWFRIYLTAPGADDDPGLAGARALARAALRGHRRANIRPGRFSDSMKGSSMKVRVHVSLKNGVLDPQGRAIHHAIEGLGFDGVKDVRAGRLFELEVDDSVTDAQLDEMASKLLANMVIENYRIERVAA